MYGFYGKILKIDLDKETFSIEPVDDQILKTCLGGKGLATHLLLDLNPPQVDPLGPENLLIFRFRSNNRKSGYGALAVMAFIPNPPRPVISRNLIQAVRWPNI